MPSTINASTSSGIVSTADTSGVLELQSNGTTKLTVASTGAYGQLVSGTAVASTSGTSIDFTSIPSWVKRITVMFAGVSTSATSFIQAQIGSGSIDTASTYLGACSNVGGTNNAGAAQNTTGFLICNNVVAASTYNGALTFTTIGSNTWCLTGTLRDRKSVV
jgi:hypothetical protein